MRAITIALTLAAAVALSACGAFQTKPDQALASGGKVKDPVITDMRFDPAGLVESTSESGCNIKSVKIEASKRRDMIDITCRTLIEGASTTTTTITSD